MVKKSRIKNLSTRFLMPYKVFIWALLLLIFSALVYFFIGRVFDAVNFSSWRSLLPALFFCAMMYQYSWLLYKYYQRNNKLYHVEFDDEFIYVIQKNADLIVPLENVKDINLKTMIGHWEIIFYHAEQLGDKIYFKPSLLYPFNSKKKDALVNVLWSNIENAKKRKPFFQRNALHS